MAYDDGETLPYQWYNHMSDCSVQYKNGAKNPEATVGMYTQLRISNTEPTKHTCPCMYMHAYTYSTYMYGTYSIRNCLLHFVSVNGIVIACEFSHISLPAFGIASSK